jgi:hypothetical protein
MTRKTVKPSKTNNLTFHLSFHREDSNERVLRFEEIYKTLDLQDQLVIEGCVSALATNARLKGMGTKGAFELIGCLGEWLAWHPIPEEAGNGNKKSD